MQRWMMCLAWGVMLLMPARAQEGGTCPAQKLMAFIQAQHQHWQACEQQIATYQSNWLAFIEGKGPQPESLAFPASPGTTLGWSWHEVAPVYRADLQKKSEAFARLMQQIHSLHARLARVSTTATTDRAAHLVALDVLRRLHLYTEDARSLQGELVFLAEQAHQAHIPAIRSSESALVEQVHALVVHSRVLMLAVGTGLAPRIDRAHGRLLSGIEQARSRRVTLLGQWGDDPELTRRYDQAIAQAEQLARAAIVPISLADLSPREQRWGLAHHRYNQRLNPIFNQLVQTHNRLLASLATTGRLFALGELPRMKVLVPPPPAEVPLPDLTYAPEQNLVCLVDVSGSMQQPHGLPLFRSACTELVRALRAHDHVSLVTFAGQAKAVLRATAGTEQARILRALETLDSRGPTRIHAGFLAGYRELRKHWSAEGNNRLLLITDGGFDITAALLQDIEQQAARGAVLTVLYFGEESPRMQYRLRRLAEVGGGTCVRIESGSAVAQLIEAIHKVPVNMVR